VDERNWRGSGPDFALALGSISLSLNVAKANPGFEPPSCYGEARLLALEGMGKAGQYDPLAFNERSLIGWNLVRRRIVASYTPLGWGGLSIRAAWSPLAGPDGFDLEIQASADSPAKLEDVEVVVVSRWIKADGRLSSALASRVEARDAPSAAHSYDGREPAAVLSRLTTLPLTTNWSTALEPLAVAVPGAARSLHYIEMVQPDDVARRIMGIPVDEPTASQLVFSARYGLLGHDIEKGVVLRARLRGLWLESENAPDQARELWRQFLHEPLPLGP
jgi:hypothetical protein